MANSLNVLERISALPAQVTELIVVPSLNHKHVRVLCLSVQFVGHTQHACIRIDCELALQRDLYELFV